MRLKRLKIKNINSFLGEFEIDFEKFYDSVFLISGPTGSGKTTIIDSILAALYNKTPRLGHTRDLINKESKEAGIELVFEMRGDEYRIKWRGKKRPKSVEVKRVLFKNEEEIADKEKEIESFIKDLLKMSFSEFTKAIVLAQGQFDAFLSAKSDEKMKLLENILDVSEFEKISIRVFEAYRELEAEIGDIKKRLDEIKTDENDLKEKEKGFREIEKLLKKLQNDFEKYEKEFQKIMEKERLKAENEKILKEIKEVEKELKSIDLKNLEKIFLEKEKVFLVKEKEYEKTVSFLDEEIRKEIEKNALVSKKEDLVKRKEKGEELIRKLAEKNKILEEEIKGFREKFESIKVYKDEALESFEEVGVLFERIKELELRYRQRRKKLKEILSEIQNCKNEYDLKEKELKELEEKKEYLEAKLIVLKYENERKNLKENTPCPLCGSIEHPYVKNPPPIEDGIKKEFEEVLLKTETFKKYLEKIKTEILSKKALVDSLEKEMEEIVNEGKKVREKLNGFGLDEKDYEKLKAKKIHNEKAEKEMREIEKLLLKKKTEVEKNGENIEIYKRELEKIEDEITKNDKKIKEIALKVQNPLVEKERIKNEFNNLKKEFEAIKSEYLQKKEETIRLNAFLNEKQKSYTKNTEKLQKININDLEAGEKRDAVKKEIEYLNIKKGEILKETEHIKRELEKKEELRKKIKEKEKKYALLLKLNKAIGSRDGKKFKQIAINKMIDGLIFATNVHLEKLSDGRYMLTKGEDVSRIELDIIDTFYENKKRSVNTLSGGEKFLVSLSLSFALSDLIRDRVKIDFMFLDEGFGTLDNYNLIKTLEILKKASVGKTIGIISHVDALKEEIHKGIKVVKKEGGKSRIETY